MNQQRSARDWRYVLAIAAILVLAVVLRWSAYSPWDQHHADEFYQYLEQANRLVTGYGVVPWESRFGIRNGLIPQFLSLPIRLGDLIAPAGMLPIHLARASFTALCLLALAGAWGIGAAKSRRHALVALFVAAVWFDSVRFSVLLLSESVGTAVIACGAALLLIDHAKARHLRLAGFLLVLGCLLRLQYAPFVAVLVLASARLDRRMWWELSLGGVAALVLGAVSDVAGGQVPMAWVVNNVAMNIGEGRAAGFGEEGPRYYLDMLVLALGPAIPVILAAALLAGRKYWPLLLAVGVNLAVHTAIGHKEYRFIWLSVFLILVLAAIGSVNGADWLAARHKPGRTAGWLALLVLCLGWFGLAQTVLGDSADKRLKLKGGAYALAAHDVAARPEVCGLSIPEDRTGNVIEALLRRNVPLYVVPLDMTDGISPLPPELAGAANATISSGEDLPLDPEYRLVTCHERGGEKACLLIRPGPCDAAAGADYTIEALLRRTDM